MHRVFATLRPRNVGSGRVLQNIGMRFAKGA
jgi:RimJ/RimL family protein N-acetyltransferase